MASITCQNGHTHGSVLEVKQCVGLVAAPVAPMPAVSYPAGYAAVDLITDRQLAYIVSPKLKGDGDYARRLTKTEASTYIKALLHAARFHLDPSTALPKGYTVTAPPPPPEVEPEPTEEKPKTTKSDMVAGLIDMVPDGYFAVQRSEGEKITFLRVNRPTYGKKKGGLKVQTQHGPVLHERWVRWPSGHISVYSYSGDIEETLLLLIADFKGAAKRYADKKKKCARCNTDLTVARSRFYRIGPECEKYWEWWIEDRHDEVGRTWEQLTAAEQEKYAPQPGEL